MSNSPMGSPLREGAVHEPSSCWHSYLLKFRDPLLEKKFQDMFNRGAMHVDKFMDFSQMVVWVAMYIQHWMPCTKGTGTCGAGPHHWAILMNLGLVLLHALWITTASKETAMRWRTLAAAAVRYIPAFAQGLAAIPHSPPEVSMPTSQAVWWRVVFRAGILNSVWTTVRHPLLFKHHVWLHAVYILFFIRWLPKGFCAQLHGSNTMGCLAPSGSSWISELYEWLRVASRLVSATTCGLTSCSSSASVETPETVCVGSVMFLQLALGYWLPTAVVYHRERRARAQFLLSSTDHQEDLFALRAERHLAESYGLMDCMARVALFVIYLAKSLWVIILIWQILAGV